jgi:hypothetical protein
VSQQASFAVFGIKPFSPRIQRREISKMDTQSGYTMAATRMEYKPVIGVGAKPEEERSNSKDVVLQGMPNYVKQLIAGGVAGGLSKTAVAPLERVKILYQVGSLSLSHPFLQLLIVGYFVQNHVVQIVLLANTPSRSAFLSFLPLYSTVTAVHAQYSFPPQLLLFLHHVWNRAYWIPTVLPCLGVREKIPIV